MYSLEFVVFCGVENSSYRTLLRICTSFLLLLKLKKEEKKYQEKKKIKRVSELFEFIMPCLGIVCEANIYKLLACMRIKCITATKLLELA